MKKFLMPLLVLGLAAGGTALQRAVSDQEMVDLSQEIVYASVQEITYVYDHPTYPVMTQARLSIEDRYKGSAPGELLVTWPGGIKGEYTMKVSDTPALEPGDEGLFFLYDKEGTEALWLTGWEYGAITVENGMAHSHTFAVDHDDHHHHLPYGTVLARLENLISGEER